MQMQTKAIMIQRGTVIALICAVMIGVHVIDLVLGGFLKSFGIRPREIGSAYTIATAPWLHADFGHLGSNLASFIVLSALCLLNGIRYFLKASGLIILLTGALVWLFGREAVHIGASGWIFGLWSLAIALAWFDRSYRNIIISIAVVFFYGGMVFGVLPTNGYISFESHLFGALAGVAAASLLSQQRKPVVAVPLPETRAGELKFWS
jgi:membrane associated rhomboid family serine protease